MPAHFTLILLSKYPKFPGRLWVKCREIIDARKFREILEETVRCSEEHAGIFRVRWENYSRSSEILPRKIAGQLRVGCGVLIRCFYFSPTFSMFLCFFSKKKKSRKTHPLFNFFLRMNCLILKRLGKTYFLWINVSNTLATLLNL